MGIDRLEYLFHPKSIAVVGASERPGSVGGGAVIRNLGQAAILDFSLKERIGFSHFISLGSMLDVDFGDIIDYLGTDTKTGDILKYFEDLKFTSNKEFGPKDFFEMACSHAGAPGHDGCQFGID